ncbi:hypothetical protein BpHYR1_024372 [Brachionus plicatilis]|uniref:Uncharacterized protein n=1 Tax=Brachionus plicatilis TaxID=10195 RepID=A0A3M7R1K5_BRAPC|nr:hypothetical protein BpHYR1_024372 [Brachionus plicatilis]
MVGKCSYQKAGSEKLDSLESFGSDSDRAGTLCSHTYVSMCTTQYTIHNTHTHPLFNSPIVLDGKLQQHQQEQAKKRERERERESTI